MFHIRLALALLTGLAVAELAYPQVTLTGAIELSTDLNGAFSNQDHWNTIGGDASWVLWLAQNPDATMPINGPGVEEAGISIPLNVGHTYRFYTFASPDNPLTYAGLNLFFNGDSTSPGISVSGALNNTLYSATRGSSLGLDLQTVPGAGKAFYHSGDATAVLTSYTFNGPATPPGDVCQPEMFVPGGGPDLFGAFTLHVFPAASLTLSQSSGPPLTNLTFTASGFTPDEPVDIFGGRVAPPVIAVATADSNGAFSLHMRGPERALGPLDFYALGSISHRLGAASFFVTAAFTLQSTVVPGSSVGTQLYGFSPDELVEFYWDEPRQLIGTAASNTVGFGQAVISIPANAAPGTGTVIAVGQNSKAIAVRQVKVQ